MKVLHSSDGRGWSDIAAAITQEFPHTVEHRAISSVWVAMVLTSPIIQRKMDDQVLKGRLEPNSIVLTPPGEVVEDSIGNEPQTLHFFLRDNVLREVAEEVYDTGTVNFHYKAAFAAADPALSHLLGATRQMLLDDPRDGWRTEYISRAIANHILHRHCLVGGTQPVHAVEQLSPAQRRKVEEFLRSSLTSQFTFAELAASVGLSRTIFFQRFEQTFRQTPNQYRQALRVAKARALIGQGDIRLAEIAVMCGFSDQTHMTRFFRKVLGTTPGQYRRNIA